MGSQRVGHDWVSNISKTKIKKAPRMGLEGIALSEVNQDTNTAWSHFSGESSQARRCREQNGRGGPQVGRGGAGRPGLSREGGEAQGPSMRTELERRQVSTTLASKKRKEKWTLCSKGWLISSPVASALQRASKHRLMHLGCAQPLSLHFRKAGK